MPWCTEGHTTFPDTPLKPLAHPIHWYKQPSPLGECPKAGCGGLVFEDRSTAEVGMEVIGDLAPVPEAAKVYGYPAIDAAFTAATDSTSALAAFLAASLLDDLDALDAEMPPDEEMLTDYPETLQGARYKLKDEDESWHGFGPTKEFDSFLKRLEGAAAKGRRLQAAIKAHLAVTAV